MTCKPADLDGMVAAAKVQIKSDGKSADPLTLATYCWTPIAFCDLRDFHPECRVREAKRLVQKGFDLESDGFKDNTNIKNVPTKENAAKRITYITTLEKEYAAANDLRCCPREMAGPLRDMLGRFDDLYTAIDGLQILDSAQAEGAVLQWDKGLWYRRRAVRANPGRRRLGDYHKKFATACF